MIDFLSEIQSTWDKRLTLLGEFGVTRKDIAISCDITAETFSRYIHNKLRFEKMSILTFDKIETTIKRLEEKHGVAK